MDASFWSRVPHPPTVVVESAKGSLVKRRANGAVDFISPVPTPYNYGCIPGVVSGDGDPLDALVLGPRLAVGTHVTAPVVAVVDFLDNGERDPKLVCSNTGFSAADKAGVAAFFTVYALAKRVLWRLRGRRGDTAFCGFVPDTTWRPGSSL